MMIKLWFIGITIGWGMVFHLLQIETQFTNASLLVTAIVTLSGTIAFLFAVNKNLNKALVKKEEEHAKEIKELLSDQSKLIKEITEAHFEDYKSIISKNTTAFNEMVSSVKENTRTLEKVKDKL